MLDATNTGSRKLQERDESRFALKNRKDRDRDPRKGQGSA